MSSSVHTAKEEVLSAIFILLCICTLEGGPGPLPWVLESCKASLPVQYLQIAPRGLELQEE